MVLSISSTGDTSSASYFIVDGVLVVVGVVVVVVVVVVDVVVVGDDDGVIVVVVVVVDVDGSGVVVSCSQSAAVICLEIPPLDLKFFLKSTGMDCLDVIRLTKVVVVVIKLTRVAVVE